MVERRGHPLEGEVAAAQPHLGAAPHLGRGFGGIGVRDDRQREDPVRVGALGEIGDPVVVGLVGPGAQRRIGDQIVDHQAAVDDLGVLAVAVEIGEPQLRRRRPRLGAGLGAPLEADILHLVDMAEHPLVVGQEARADAVPHAPVLVVDKPMLPVIPLLDARRGLLPFVAALRRPQIGRAIGQVDVVVAGDELFWHRGLLSLLRRIRTSLLRPASYDRRTGGATEMRQFSYRGVPSALIAACRGVGGVFPASATL